MATRPGGLDQDSGMLGYLSLEGGRDDIDGLAIG
jgi:hypothetical protein